MAFSTVMLFKYSFGSFIIWCPLRRDVRIKNKQRVNVENFEVHIFEKWIDEQVQCIVQDMQRQVHF
jgi:hypothetical protein